MEIFIVTVKLARNKDHDPRNKKTGECPVSKHCTDVTGQHHSMLVQGLSEETIRERLESEPSPIHVTRIEQVRAPMEVTFTEPRLPTSPWARVNERIEKL